MLAERRHLDQADLAERALLPPKEARARLYALHDAGLARTVELPRTPDRPGGAVQLWAADAAAARLVVLADVRRALSKLLERRAAEALQLTKRGRPGAGVDLFDDPADGAPRKPDEAAA